MIKGLNSNFNLHIKLQLAPPQCMSWILFDVYINVLQIPQAKKTTASCQVLKLPSAGWLIKATLSLCCYHLCYLKPGPFFTPCFQCYYPSILFDWEIINMRNSFHGRWVGFFQLLLWVSRRFGRGFFLLCLKTWCIQLYLYILCMLILAVVSQTLHSVIGLFK